MTGYACKKPDVKTDTGRMFKRCIVLPNATEQQAQEVASRLNRHMSSWCRLGRGYRVLDVYPPCNTKRVVLIG